MNKQKKIGKFVFAVLIFVAVAIYLLANFYAFRSILLSMDWLSVFGLMLLYAIVPCVPAVIFRVKFKIYSRRWISLAATVVCLACIAIIAVSTETALEGREWISDFAQNALISSAPALYCVAFSGWGQDTWIAVVPSFMYFLSYFARYALAYGFVETLGLLRYFDLEFVFYQNPDPFTLASMITVVLMSAVFFAWALLGIFFSHMVNVYIARIKNDDNKKTNWRKNL